MYHRSVGIKDIQRVVVVVVVVSKVELNVGLHTWLNDLEIALTILELFV